MISVRVFSIILALSTRLHPRFNPVEAINWVLSATAFLDGGQIGHQGPIGDFSLRRTGGNFFRQRRREILSSRKAKF